MAEFRLRRAALLDRDGTIIVDEHYLGDPEPRRAAAGRGGGDPPLSRGGSSVGRVQQPVGNRARHSSRWSSFAPCVVQTAALLEAEGAFLLDSFVVPAPRGLHRRVRVPQAGHAAVPSRPRRCTGSISRARCSSATSTATSCPRSPSAPPAISCDRPTRPPRMSTRAERAGCAGDVGSLLEAAQHFMRAMR